MMGKLDEVLKNKQSENAAQAKSEQNAAINTGGTHKDGVPAGGIDRDKIPAEGQDVVVKDSVVIEGNKANVVTQAVVNDAANNAAHPTLAPADAHAENVQNAAGAAYAEGSVGSVAPDGTRMESSQQPMVVAPAEPSSAARTSNVVTGYEVGQPIAPALRSPLESVLGNEEMSDEVRTNLEAKSKGSYEARGLHRFHRANGVAVEAKDGKFYAETDEDVGILEHHAKAGRVAKDSTSSYKSGSGVDGSLTPSGQAMGEHTAVSNDAQVAGNKSIQDLNKDTPKDTVSIDKERKEFSNALDKMLDKHSAKNS